MADSNALPIIELAELFAKLPGIGLKTAQRLAYAVMDMSDADAKSFSDAILKAHSTVHTCKICQNFTDKEICPICDNPNRDKSMICVVEGPKDLTAIESSGDYKGIYHVLHGLISPINNVSPDDIRIKELLARVNTGEVTEVILATNPTVEGDATSMYISKLLKTLGVKVTRPALGLPSGALLEFADSVTLFTAIENRKEM